MVEGPYPHHVTLCALLRLYLDPAELVGQLSPEEYQHVGALLMQLLQDAGTVSFLSLTQLLTQVEVRYAHLQALQCLPAPVRGGPSYVNGCIHGGCPHSSRCSCSPVSESHYCSNWCAHFWRPGGRVQSCYCVRVSHKVHAQILGALNKSHYAQLCR